MLDRIKSMEEGLKKHKSEEKEKQIKSDPKKKKIKEIHKTVREAVKDGIIKIDTTVGEIMTKDVKIIKPEDNLRNALDILSEYVITGIPVIDDDKLVGIISEADIIKIMDVRKILDAEKDEIKLAELESIKVKDIMSKDVITIRKTELITDASELMYKHHVNRLPVMDEDKRLIGIVTKEDIIRGITKEFFEKSMKGEMRVIQTDIDKLISIVERKGPISILDVSKELNVDPEQIEEWAKILEEREMFEIEYRALGPPMLRKKK
jgi:CBS domain-containing protein